MKQDPPHLAVIDEEADIRGLLAGYFGQHGFRVSSLSTGES
jgi:DNA-binding response OmpR family regulator